MDCTGNTLTCHVGGCASNGCQFIRVVQRHGGVSLEHDGPCVFVDGECPCGMLDIGA